MSYYPTERQGGCMESISRCCRQVYVYPIDSRKLLYAAGGVLGIIIVAVVWTGLSSSGSSSAASFQGHTVLTEVPLIVGSNFFLKNLKTLANNSVYNLKFDQNLQNDTVFGDAVCKYCQTDLSRLKKGLVGSQLWSIDVSCTAQYRDSVSLTMEQVDAISRLISRYTDTLDFTTSSSEFTSNFNNGKVSSVLAVTSGLSIDGRMAVLRILHSLGVRVMALTSECSSDWAESYCMDTNQTTGLSTLGQKIVKEMNRLGVVIDLSGSSHQTQLDVLNITKAPVIFSRAAAYSLHNHSRNIHDDVIDLINQNGGLLMVTFAGQYLSDNSSNTSIQNVMEHLNYFKERIDVTVVGIGAEFDAENEIFPSNLKDVSTFPNLFDELGKTWSEEELKKLAGQNFLRVLKAVEKYASDSASQQADETYNLYVSNSTDTVCYSDINTRNGNVKNESTDAPSTVMQVSTEKLASTEQAASTEKPATTEQPASTAKPVTTAKPVSTAKPATTEQPVTTEIKSLQ